MTLANSLLNQKQDCGIMSRERVLLMAVRQALIIALGALEDYLNLERSIVPQRKRGNHVHAQEM